MNMTNMLERLMVIEKILNPMMQTVHIDEITKEKATVYITYPRTICDLSGNKKDGLEFFKDFVETFKKFDSNMLDGIKLVPFAVREEEYTLRPLTTFKHYKYSIMFMGDENPDEKSCLPKICSFEKCESKEKKE